MTIRPQ